jgi:hypothetical protein
MQAEFFLATITLTTIAFLAGDALVWVLHPKTQRFDTGPLHRKVQTVGPQIEHQFSMAASTEVRTLDPRIERQFSKVFIRASKEGKEAIIKGWTDRKKCSREEAMRLAVEEWRVQNRSWR